MAKIEVDLEEANAARKKGKLREYLETMDRDIQIAEQRGLTDSETLEELKLRYSKLRESVNEKPD